MSDLESCSFDMFFGHLEVTCKVSQCLLVFLKKRLSLKVVIQISISRLVFL